MDTLEFLLDRVKRGPGSTLGELLVDPPADGPRPPRLCWMLEEAWHEVKVQGETCIPPGRYELTLTHDSPMAQRYYERYDWFRGLLVINAVPNFTAVRIHVGNDAVNDEEGDDDTDGCPLPGLEAVPIGGGDHRVLQSVPATKLVHETAYAAFDEGKRVFLEVTDHQIRL